MNSGLILPSHLQHERTKPGPVPTVKMGEVKKELAAKIERAFVMSLVVEEVLLKRSIFGRLKWLLLGK